SFVEPLVQPARWSFLHCTDILRWGLPSPIPSFKLVARRKLGLLYRRGIRWVQ
ncbi:uncharacterized protein EI90DRAFT_3042375, partial [Cantharellus anzutake]|uniref:uncharacterized protein n=1 Tax=Cantharellus anzutake TaxID=1750568 RepID=UPI001906ADF1